MDADIERIAEVIAARVRAQIPCRVSATAEPESKCSGGCEGCGHCACKRPESVKRLVEHGLSRVSAAPGAARDYDRELASLIDHTLLKPDATPDDLAKLCDEARRYEFASVCVNSANVSRCQSLLRGSPVKVCAVVGFPLGAMAPGAKAFEAREAVRAGAREIDMVLNIGALKANDFGLVRNDIQQVVRAARPAKVKVILETGMLTDEQKVAGCTLAKLAGAHFVKTSTGFGKGGATVADISLMRRVVGDALGVKASGGIRSSDDANQMVRAGANRIGASASVSIVTGQTSSSSY